MDHTVDACASLNSISAYGQTTAADQDDCAYIHSVVQAEPCHACGWLPEGMAERLATRDAEAVERVTAVIREDGWTCEYHEPDESCGQCREAHHRLARKVIDAYETCMAEPLSRLTDVGHRTS